MNIEFHELLNGEKVKVKQGDSEGDSLVRWLINEALKSYSWLEFQQRTSHAVVEYAKEIGGKNWETNDVYKLQLDFVGQIGVATNELKGKITETFGALLLSSVMTCERSSRAGLLILLAQAANNQKALDKDHLHLTVFDLRLRNISPFGYAFDLRPPNIIFSSDLADDYESIENAHLLEAASPIYVTTEGNNELKKIGRKYISLLPAIDALIEKIRAVNVEELFSEFRAKAFEAAL